MIETRPNNHPAIYLVALEAQFKAWLSKNRLEGFAQSANLMSHSRQLLGQMQPDDDFDLNHYQPAFWGISSQVLYQAFCQSEGELQIEGATVLANHLWPIAQAISEDNAIADIATNQALANIWQARDKIKSPVAFLNFCKVTLRHIVRASMKAHSLVSTSLDAPVGQDSDTTLAEVLADSSIAIEEEVELKASESELANYIVKIKGLTPRDKQIIFLLWLDGLDNEAVSQQLNVTLSTLHTILSRLRERLKKDTGLMTMLNKHHTGGIK